MASAWQDVVLKAVEDDGMDFWWIDWQQGEDKGNTGQDGRRDQKMNPTIWTAKARVTDSTRRCVLGRGCTKKRGVTFARWGGLGQHRYQHGFSGDVDGLTWANLAYQAYFSATVSRVEWRVAFGLDGCAFTLRASRPSRALLRPRMWASARGRMTLSAPVMITAPPCCTIFRCAPECAGSEYVPPMRSCAARLSAERA